MYRKLINFKVVVLASATVITFGLFAFAPDGNATDAKNGESLIASEINPGNEIYLTMFEEQLSQNRLISSLKNEIAIEKLKVELVELRKESGQLFSVKSDVKSAPKTSVKAATCPTVLYKLNTGADGKQVLVGYRWNGKEQILPFGSRVNGCVLK